jgi:hypothetical protein
MGFREGSLFPWKSIWWTKTPLRATFFYLVSGPTKNPYPGQILRNSMSLWLIGAICVRRMDSPLIFFSIVRLCVPYGMLSSVVLGFLGLCLYELLTYLHIGGLLVALPCKRWYFLVFYGVFWANYLSIKH